MRTQLTFGMFDPDEKSALPKHSTSEFPDRFINDVNSFMEYCSTTTISLTKTTKTLSRRHLQNLNEQLSVKAEKANAYSPQEFYPYIDFIFRIMRSSRLFEIQMNGKNLIPGDTDRFTAFKDFTTLEKYCFLLETFWVDMNWDDLLESNTNQVLSTYSTVFAALYPTEPNKKWNIVNPKTEIGELLHIETLNWQNFFLYFEWFGLWTCEPDIERMNNSYRKNTFYAKNITVTELGKQMMPILLIDRNLQLWNIAFRKLYDIVEWIPGMPRDSVFDFGLSTKDANRLEVISHEDQSLQPFYLPFVPLFAEGTLNKTLPRIQNSFLSGAYTLRVNYDQNIWRKIKLPATATMEDLHYGILNAYDFDDDHLYSFFTDGKKWSAYCIASPCENLDHADASKIQIGSIGMLKSQPIVYVYDYGYEWTFTVFLEEIDEQNSEIFTPCLIDGIGEAPVQYFFSEDEEDEW